METVNIHQTVTTQSNKAIWASRIMGGLCILFLFVDAIMKIFMNHYHVEGTVQLQWSSNAVQPIGIVLLICTLLYSIPRTAILGAILLTGYLGGAIATMARVGEPFYFPFIFSILIWGALFLRDEKLRAIFPLKR